MEWLFVITILVLILIAVVCWPVKGYTYAVMRVDSEGEVSIVQTFESLDAAMVSLKHYRTFSYSGEFYVEVEENA